MNPESLLQELKRFDSNIEIHDSLNEFSKEYVQVLINRRLKDINADCLDDALERLRTLNLLSFLFFAIGNKKEAVSYNDKALDIDGRSINALTCRAYYYLKWEDFYESEKQLNALKSTEHNRVANLVAKAEVAYAYTKIGFEHYQKAAERFEEVLSDCRDIPEKYVCSWKYSWALAIRRQSNFADAPRQCNIDDPDTYLKKAEVLYRDIIAMSDDSIRRYKARAYVDLGLEICFGRDFQSAKKQYEQTDSFDCIEQALLLEPEDEFVLSRSGTYFRLISNPQKAIELLRKAVTIKETSFSYHHLALALGDLIASTRRDGASGHRPSDNTSTSPMGAKDKRSHQLMDETTLLQDNEKSSWSERYPLATKLPSQHQKKELEKKGFKTHSQKEILFNRLIKSPGKLHYFPSEKTGEIIRHLDEAFRLNNKNIAALYDKGLLLRSSEQYTDAVDVFKTMFQEPSCSTLQLAFAYEQAALCLIEEAGKDPTKLIRNEHNAKLFLSKSVELSYGIISTIPGLSRSLGPFPVRTDGNLKDLSRLYKKDKDLYPKAKEVFEKLIQLEGNAEEKLDVMLELFDASLLHEHYDLAIMAMYGILRLPNGNERIDISSCVRALIKGGIAAWHKDEKLLTKKRLKAALNIKEFWQHNSEEIFESEISYDIFLLSSDSSEDVARPVANLLQTFGPRVTLNSDFGMPGQMEVQIKIEAINKSEFIVVFLAAEEEDADLKYMQLWFTDKSGKSTMTISESNRSARDPVYCRLPSVPYQSGMFLNTNIITEEQVEWIENFLFTLTGVNPT